MKNCQEYLVCETLGRGSSGIVHRVKRLRDGHIFAMKAAVAVPLPNGGFHKWGYPKMDGVYVKIRLKWMIWGYPQFRKPP